MSSLTFAAVALWALGAARANNGAILYLFGDLRLLWQRTTLPALCSPEQRVRRVLSSAKWPYGNPARPARAHDLHETVVERAVIEAVRRASPADRVLGP